MLHALALSLFLACGASPEAQLQTANDALAAKNYDGAVAAADEGLKGGAKGATAWRLELVVLESQARGNKGADTLATIERLAEAYKAQVTGALYVQTAGQLKEAGDAKGAIAILDAGAKRFPDDEAIKKAIAQTAASGDADDLEQLRTLGYIE